MSGRRARLDAVLRVRQVQERQAAADLARLRAAEEAAEVAEEEAADRYRRLPAPSADQTGASLRTARAQALVLAALLCHNRDAARRASGAAGEGAAALAAASRAVAGLERMGQRLEQEARREQLRAAQRELDDVVATRLRSPR